jgi:hypothetical protein
VPVTIRTVESNAAHTLDPCCAKSCGRMLTTVTSTSGIASLYIRQNCHFNESCLTLQCLPVPDGEARGGNLVALLTALGPVLSGCFDLIPIRSGPPIERGKWFIERTAELSEPVEGSGLNPPTVHVAHDQSISFRSSERVGKNLVRDSTEGVVKLLVTTPAFGQFSQNL